MRTQDDVARHVVWVDIHEEGVLHVACRVVGGEVQLRVDVEVILHLGTVGDVEAHAGEYVDDLVLHDGERMTCAQSDGVSRAGQVEFVAAVVLTLEHLFQGGDALLRALFQFVELHADLLFLFSRHIAEVRHQFTDDPFLAEVFDAQCFQFLGTVGLQGLYL